MTSTTSSLAPAKGSAPTTTDLLRWVSAYRHHLYAQVSLTPRLLNALREKGETFSDPSYKAYFESLMNKAPEPLFKPIDATQAQTFSTAQQQQYQAKLSDYIAKDGESDDDIIQRYTPWFQRFGSSKKAKENRRKRLRALVEAIDKESLAFYQHVTLLPEETELQDLKEEKTPVPVKSPLTATPEKAIQTAFTQSLQQSIKKLKKRSHMNSALTIMGWVAAVLVSASQGILFTYFAKSVFQVASSLSVAIGIFGFGANIILNISSLPSTLIDLFNGNLWAGLNKKTNTRNMLRLKKALILLSALPALGVGVSYGLSTYASMMIGPHAAIHWHFFAILAGASPQTFAIFLAIISAVALSCLFYKTIVGLIKADKERDFIIFLKYFFKPRPGTQVDSRFQYAVTNAISLLFILGGMVVMGLGAYSGLSGLFHAGSVIKTVPYAVNVAMTYVLAAIARVPFFTNFAVYLFGGVSRGVVSGLFGLFSRDIKKRRAMRSKIARGFKIAFVKHPVLAWGAIGAAAYSLVRLVQCLFKQYAWKALGQDIKNGFKILIEHPWTFFGWFGGIAVSGGNFLGNFYLANHDIMLPARISAGATAMTVCSSSYVKEGSKMLPGHESSTVLDKGLYEQVRAIQSEENLLDDVLPPVHFESLWMSLKTKKTSMPTGWQGATGYYRPST